MDTTTIDAPRSSAQRVRDRALYSVAATSLLFAGSAGGASATTGTLREQFGQQAVKAKDEGLGVLSDNVVYLLAMPVAWVGYKVIRRVISKIG
jgi:hypothetical protein